MKQKIVSTIKNLNSPNLKQLSLRDICSHLNIDIPSVNPNDDPTICSILDALDGLESEGLIIDNSNTNRSFGRTSSARGEIALSILPCIELSK